MLTKAQNDLLTRVEGDAPMGKLMRENYWFPFALSSQLKAGDAPMQVRLIGSNYVAFRAADGRIGFFDELCPHRRASLALARVEGNGLRCIFHGWKMDVSGRVAEAPTQLVKAEEFAAHVKVDHFPVHEAGGLVWVWLGAAKAPKFPDLPFVGSHETNTWLSVSTGQCNWLQGVEGTLDSAHVGTLHKTWISKIAERKGPAANIGMALDGPPRYETQFAPYGLRAAALRPLKDGSTYARVTEYFMPFVCLVPIDRPLPRDGVIFIVSPVDDTHHLLFFGHYSEKTLQNPIDTGVQPAGVPFDQHNYAPLPGGRAGRWGQDRALMHAGHFTGFGKNLIEEDMVVQASMGPILDRTKENLSSSDVAVVQGRNMLLQAMVDFQEGKLPPGSALAVEPVSMANPLDAVLKPGMRWDDFSFEQAAA